MRKQAAQCKGVSKARHACARSPCSPGASTASAYDDEVKLVFLAVLCHAGQCPMPGNDPLTVLWCKLHSKWSLLTKFRLPTPHNHHNQKLPNRTLRHVPLPVYGVLKAENQTLHLALAHVHGIFGHVLHGCCSTAARALNYLLSGCAKGLALHAEQPLSNFNAPTAARCPAAAQDMLQVRQAKMSTRCQTQDVFSWTRDRQQVDVSACKIFARVCLDNLLTRPSSHVGRA